MICGIAVGTTASQQKVMGSIPAQGTGGTWGTVLLMALCLRVGCLPGLSLRPLSAIKKADLCSRLSSEGRTNATETFHQRTRQGVCMWPPIHARMCHHIR